MRRFLLRGSLVCGLIVWAPIGGCSKSEGGSTGGTTPGPTPAITLSLGQTTITIEQGASGSFNVTVSGTGGFSGAANITTEGLPVGVRAAVSDVTSSAGVTTAKVTISVGPAVVVGQYAVTVGASASGVASVSGTVSLTVDEPPAIGISLDFSNCQLADTPIWLAFMDGTAGSWTQLAGSGAVYSFNLARSKAGVAWASAQGANRYSTQVFFLTATELATLTATQICGLGGKIITGVVNNLTLGDVGIVSYGGAFGFAIPSGGPAAVQIDDAADGVHDLVAYVRNALGGGAGDRMLIRRDRDIPAGGSFAPIDVAGAEVFTPASATVTVTGIQPGEDVTQQMLYRTGSACTEASLYLSPAAGSVFSVSGAPAAVQRATDYHQLRVIAGTATESRLVMESFHTIAARTMALSAPMPVPTVTTLPGAFKRLRFQFVPPQGLPSTTLVHGDTDRDFAVIASASYMDASSVDVSTPDFGASQGYDPAWGPGSGSTVDWTARADGDVFADGCEEGARIATAQRSGTI